MRLKAATIAGVLALCGCATPHANETASPQTSPQAAATAPPHNSADTADAAATIDRTVDYWQYIQGLPTEALAREYDRVMAEHLADRDDPETRIDLIFLLTLPNTRWRNLDAAVSLVNQYVDNADDDDALLNWFLFLNDDIQQERYLERQLKTLQQRQQQLQQQLEELKSIERSLQQRTAPSEETQ